MNLLVNKQHLKILIQGEYFWNVWRKDNPEETPDLMEAKLNEAELTGVNLNHVNLTGADIRRANLTEADLTGADLEFATMD